MADVEISEPFGALVVAYTRIHTYARIHIYLCTCTCRAYSFHNPDLEPYSNDVAENCWDRLHTLEGRTQHTVIGGPERRIPHPSVAGRAELQLSLQLRP